MIQAIMTPVIPYSINNVSLAPETSFIIRKSNCLTRCKFLAKSTKQTSSSQRFLLPLSTSVRLFPHYRSGSELYHKSRIHILSATGTDVAVEEADTPVIDEGAGGDSEDSPNVVETSEESSTKSTASPTPAQSKRSRPSRRSEMPPVKNEELIPGATFTGKVRSIQPFGAFVDFGAFTDGLVHVSRLSESFVKDVGSIVSIGQEVKVRLVEANTETGRISLTMRESDDISKMQQQRDSPAGSDGARPTRRNTSKSNQRKDDGKRSSKFVKGQDLEGTVKNLTRAGAFISLPEGAEGFLPSSEEVDEGFVNMMGGSSLQVGQEVSVRVLRITRGQVTLTMKKEEDAVELDSQLGQGVVHAATNPFLLAFRKNKDIATFLDEREKVMAAKIPEVQTIEEEAEGISEILATEGSASTADQIIEEAPTKDRVEDDAQSKESADEILSRESLPSEGVIESLADDTIAKDEVQIQTPTAENEIPSATSVEDVGSTAVQTIVSESVNGATQTIEEEAEVSSEILAPEGSAATADPTRDGVEDDAKSVESADEILSSESLPSKGDIESLADDTITKDEVQIQTPTAENEIPSATSEGSTAVQPILSDSVDGFVQTIKEEAEVSSEILAPEGSVFTTDQIIEEASTKDGVEDAAKSTSFAESADQISSSESLPSKEVIESSADDATEKDEVQIQTPTAKNEIPTVIPVEDENVGPIPEKTGSASNSNGQTSVPSPEENVTKAAISPALVKQLRDETGAGMMDCKKALSETGGDVVKAQEFLRKKGLASADKKASRATAEGRIGSYIHDSRIGILIEVNCETDFVSRGDIFKELVDDLAMQVAACPQVQYLVTEDVPEEIVSKEREIEMQKEDLLSKPEQIRSKIVEGRIRKRLEELALLEQPYIKNDKVIVKDWLKQTIATIGENMKVKRFVRYNLGEGLEKKSQDFAAEVAAQTAAKAEPAPGKQQPAVVEAKEAVEKPPTVTVSAALVKQLREETGAGMMDCKKALSETGGDLEKAQEYLRKKGLSTADKKSSRLAAEGRIGSYIHDSRIGVLIEINCETDFVGRSEQFKELVDDLAMQVVACPQVQFVSVEDIPESIVSKEKELEMQREDLQSKPENIRERIVQGRISKRLGELALLEQPFIKNDSLLVKDLVKQTVAALGENIKVRRFVRFTLGEEIENAKIESEA